jgi:hypothetical protein
VNTDQKIIKNKVGLPPGVRQTVKTLLAAR